MENVIIRQNNRKIVYSNRIYCLSNEPISIEYKSNEEDSIIFDFSFIKSDKGENKGLIYNGEGNHVKIDCLYSGLRSELALDEAVKIGTVNFKPFYLFFYICKITKKCHVLDITFYVDE